MNNEISRLAERVTGDPFFLASALQDYARSEELNDEALAQLLGCSQETLALLRLCRRPRSEAVSLQMDIDRIVTRFNVQGNIIAEVVRRANVIEALRRAATQTPGLLMAARDRRESSERPPEE
jgi:hypothetical protein